MKTHLSILRSLLFCLIIASLSSTETTPAPEGTFTVAIIPDTQRYLGRGTKHDPDPATTDEVSNHIFEAATEWIAANLEEQRIIFVTHVGDIVDRNNHDQWRVARHCMDKLHGKVPYGISVGNHDMSSSGNSALFQQYFPARRFEQFAWYGGSFPASQARPNVSGNNANSYQLIRAEGVDLIFLHLECNAPDEVLEWASEILRKYPERQAILTTHMWLGPIEKPSRREDGDGIIRSASWHFVNAPKGRMQWHKIHGSRGNSPQAIWDKFASRHANLFLIISGDQSRSHSLYQGTEAQHGNLVHEMMFDYGSGRNLRLLRFIPAENRIKVITLNIESNQLIKSSNRVDDIELWQYSMDFKMTGAAPRPELAD